jgi:hypothetical protein
MAEPIKSRKANGSDGIKLIVWVKIFLSHPKVIIQFVNVTNNNSQVREILQNNPKLEN